jgi:hypothetical protein
VQPHEELFDKEIAVVLLQCMARAGRLPQYAEVFLAGLCAEHLADGLRAGLVVSRPMQWRLHR